MDEKSKEVSLGSKYLTSLPARRVRKLGSKRQGAGFGQCLGKKKAAKISRLFQEKKDAADVVATLRADGAVSEPLRRAALRLVMPRGNE